MYEMHVLGTNSQCPSICILKGSSTFWPLHLMLISFTTYSKGIWAYGTISLLMNREITYCWDIKLLSIDKILYLWARLTLWTQKSACWTHFFPVLIWVQYFRVEGFMAERFLLLILMTSTLNSNLMLIVVNLAFRSACIYCHYNKSPSKTLHHRSLL